MNLNRVWIKNFRSIQECTLKIDKNFQVLVGINEAGKSNIIKALALLDPDVQLSKNDIRDPSPDEESLDQSIVRFAFTLTTEEQKAIEEQFKTKMLAKNKNSNIVSISDKDSNLNGFIKQKSEAAYTVNLSTQKRFKTHYTMNESKFRVLPHWKKIIPGKTRILNNGVNKVDIANYSIVNIKDFPELELSNVEDLDIAKLNTLVGAKYLELPLPKCISWTYADSYLLPGKIDLSDFKKDPSMCLPLKIMFSLSGHEDAAKTIDEAEARTNGIKNLFKRISEVTTSHLRKVWPEWSDLKVQVHQNGEFVEAGIEDAFNFYSLERRSDGFKRFFTFLLMMSAQNKTRGIKNNVVLIDEPEIGLHPNGQNYLRDELIKIAKNNIVLISTHSIFMIDKEQIDRHLIVTKTKEITKISNIESSNITEEEVVYKALGFSLFEILKARNIIFEGWRDKRVFELFIGSKKSLSTNVRKNVESFGLLHSLGVKDIPRTAVMCENFSREYVIISDSDKPAIEKQRDHDGKGKWVTYHDIPDIVAVTTEDFVSKKNINKAIRDTFIAYKIDDEFTIGQEISKGYLGIIEDHIKSIVDVPFDSKKLMNDIKDHIVENLKASDLESSYKKVVEYLVAEVISPSRPPPAKRKGR